MLSIEASKLVVDASLYVEFEVFATGTVGLVGMSELLERRDSRSRVMIAYLRTGFEGADQIRGEVDGAFTAPALAI